MAIFLNAFSEPKFWNGLYRARHLLVLLLCIVSIGSTATPAHAAAGDLDLTFSQDGKLFDSIYNGGDDEIKATAMQPDGKIVAAGQFAFGLRRSCAVSRYNTDGTLDTTFDGDGHAVVPNGIGVVCEGLALQADGKIVAAGHTGGYGGPVDFILFRWNANGSPDTSFDLDGMVVTPVGPAEDRAYAVAIQPDGKIVAAGAAYVNGNYFALVRYNPNGSLDTSFDSDGKVSTLVGFAAAEAHSIALQSDGKIVTAGYGYDFGAKYYALARHNTDGSRDTSFATDGVARVQVSVYMDIAYSVAIQPDGKILAAGMTLAEGPEPPSGQEEISIIRLNANGFLDTSFDTDGKVVTPIFNTDEAARDVAVQADGKIVVSGYSRHMSNNSGSFAVLRYNTDGSPDNSFGSNGLVFTRLGEESLANVVMQQPDGKIIAAGYKNNYGHETFAFALVRYNTNGSVDNSFSSDGIVIDDFGYSVSSALAVAIQPNGKFVVGGFTQTLGLHDFAITRYNADGSRDTSFDNDGKVQTDLSGPDVDDVRALAIQADGKIVAVGPVAWHVYDPQSSNMGVVRYNTDGSLDTTFDLDGKVTTDLGAFDFANGVAIQPDGKIVVAAGVATFGNGYDITLLRYNIDGSPDTTFDGDGNVNVTGLDSDVPNALALQPDGKIVAAGVTYGGSNSDFVVVRYNSNGTPDTSFDSDGVVVTPVLGANDGGNAIAVQQDGKIVVAGYANDGANNRIAVVRYNANGSLDSTFDSDGKLTTAILNGADQATAIAIQANGKIVVGGYANNGQFLPDDFAMVRYNTNGSLDTTFSGDGKFTFDFWGSSEDHLYAMALDSTGKAILAGDASGNFAVARVTGDTRAPFDYDADGKTDVSVYRPGSTGTWYIQRSQAGFYGLEFGGGADKIVPADYDGDNKTDIAVYRPSEGMWYRFLSATQSFLASPWGAATDIPTPGDFDHDGRADIAIFRPSDGNWWLNRSTAGTLTTQFGQNLDVPVVGDYDGDGTSDIGVFRPANGLWFIRRSTAGDIGYLFGFGTDKVTPADYDGDGKTDIAVYRPATGQWFIVNSGSETYPIHQFGAPTDIPVPGDYDGDGRADVAIFRPSDGNWWIQRTTAGLTVFPFGQNGDRPTPYAFGN